MQQENEKEKNYLPTKVTLTIRVLVGGYLLYTAYSLIDALKSNTGQQKLFFGAFLVLFTVAGGFLVIQGVRALAAGKYAGGAMDTSIEEESAVEVLSQEQETDEANQDH